MRGYQYTILNTFTGKSFRIGVDEGGNQVSQSGNGMLLQDNPAFELDIRNEELDKAGQHGIWDFFSFYGKRNITFTGIILASSYSNLTHLRNLIKSVLSLPSQPINGVNDGYITITWTDSENVEWSVSAKLTQDVQFSRNSGNQLTCSFFVNLKASSPYILSTETHAISYYMGWKQGSMPVPMFLPSSATDRYNDIVNIYQSGTGEAPATFRLYGPAVNPVLRKLTEVTTNNTSISLPIANWTGGTIDTTHTLLSGSAIKLSSVAGASVTAGQVGTWDFSAADYISAYFFVDDCTNFAYGDVTVGGNYIRLSTTYGVDEFAVPLYLGNRTLRNGWNYIFFRKDDFMVTGSPNWSNITNIELGVKAKDSTTINVTFDDFRNKDITYTEANLELGYTLSSSEYVDFDVLNGTVTKNDGTDLSVYLSSASQYFYVSTQQNLFVYLADNVDPNVTGQLPRVFANPVVEDDLIAYWHFDEADNAVATDYVGGNDGAVVTANSIVGSANSGKDFNGVTGSITVPDTNILREFFSGGATLSFDIYPRSDGQNNLGVIVGKADNALTQGWAVQTSSEAGGLIKLRLVQGFSGSVGTWESTLVVPLSTWSRVTIQYDSSSSANNPTLKLGDTVIPFPVLGVAAGTLLTDFGYDLRMGNSNADDRTYDGIVDEVRMYKATLTDLQLVDLNGKIDPNKYIDQVTVTWQDAIL